MMPEDAFELPNAVDFTVGDRVVVTNDAGLVGMRNGDISVVRSVSSDFIWLHSRLGAIHKYRFRLAPVIERDDEWKSGDCHFTAHNTLAAAKVEWPTTGCPPSSGKSSGGSTAYYNIPANAKDLQDLIELKKMNFSRANIFKAAYRLGEKDNTSDRYDLNKIIWFAQRMLGELKS